VVQVGQELSELLCSLRLSTSCTNTTSPKQNLSPPKASMPSNGLEETKELFLGKS
jgi:hypothetical protein